MSKKYISRFGNHVLTVLLAVYFTIILILSYLVCYFSYQQKKEELFAQIDTTYVQLLQEYQNVIDNFWQIFLPIFDTQSAIKDTLSNYYATVVSLTPIEKQELSYAAKQMTSRDNDVQWLALFNPSRDINYIYYTKSSALLEIPADFPYLEELHSPSKKMQIYGARSFTVNNSTVNSFSICSDISSVMESGKIMAGYTLSAFDSICKNNPPEITGLNYVLTTNGQILFDYSGSYLTDATYCATREGTFLDKTSNGQAIHVEAQLCGQNTSFASYYIPQSEFIRICHEYTPILILAVTVFSIISVYGYIFMQQRFNKEVNVIRDGLEIISQNHLDYRIPDSFTQNGLTEIAFSINRMSKHLKENIHRAYYYELKQKEAELSELQAKFNPHFLYNTLEMLRSRCRQSGDTDTADLITQISAIFRGFISADNFIAMTEELAFSKRYLSLFEARYDDQIKIKYDFDKDILSYGIIRNLFQPLIENYFVHGFDTSNENNYILFSGKSLDDENMLLTVEDNGCGMTSEEITKLNKTIKEPIQLATESYGLKNLHQRLQLFYGDGYGLTVLPNTNCGKGLIIQIKARKMTCEDHEMQKQNYEPFSI